MIVRNMEMYHEEILRCSRVGGDDCGPDVRSVGKRGDRVPVELFVR